MLYAFLGIVIYVGSFHVNHVSCIVNNFMHSDLK